MAKPDPTGYGAKTARGERPFIYSEQHADWQRAAKLGGSDRQDEARDAWARRFARHTLERGRSRS